MIIGIACVMSAAAWGQERHIRPEHVVEMPKVSLEKWKNMPEDFGDDEENQSQQESAKFADLYIYEDLYGGYCSWYCGGVIDTVRASSCLKPIGKIDYKAMNAHDFDHQRVWAEGAAGQGIGEWLEYEFPGRCPRITKVKILNGYVKTEKAWQDNSRPKALRMYYMGRPYAILDLDDSRTLQIFDVGVLGPHDERAPSWTLRFEILEVYPGKKYADTVISELYFDGIDVH